MAASPDQEVTRRHKLIAVAVLATVGLGLAAVYIFLAPEPNPVPGTSPANPGDCIKTDHGGDNAPTVVPCLSPDAEYSVVDVADGVTYAQYTGAGTGLGPGGTLCESDTGVTKVLFYGPGPGGYSGNDVGYVLCLGKLPSADGSSSP